MSLSNVGVLIRLPWGHMRIYVLERTEENPKSSLRRWRAEFSLLVKPCIRMTLERCMARTGHASERLGKCGEWGCSTWCGGCTLRLKRLQLQKLTHILTESLAHGFFVDCKTGSDILNGGAH